MLSAPGIIGLSELLQTLAEDVIREQTRLDQDYIERLMAFSHLLSILREQGNETLARPLAPAALNPTRIEMRLDCQFSHNRTHEFSLGVRLLNLGYRRRHSFSELTQHRLQVAIQRVPFPPGKMLAPKSTP